MFDLILPEGTSFKHRMLSAAIMGLSIGIGWGFATVALMLVSHHFGFKMK